MPIIGLTATGTGMVFAMQSYVGLSKIGGESLIGGVVSLGIIKELAPILTGLMVTARVGSAITAEIGTMRITEQIDALTTLHINIFEYLIIPRILAGLCVLPCLCLFAMVFGIIGGYFMCEHLLFINTYVYWNSIYTMTEFFDVLQGITKSLVFGLLFSWIATYKGYYTHGGARQVGNATTESVVLSSISIILADYFITKLFEL